MALAFSPRLRVIRRCVSSTSNGAPPISQAAASANYELRLYEGQSRFDVIYGTVTQGNTSATAGVQKNDTAFDQYFCNGSGGRLLAGKAIS